MGWSNPWAELRRRPHIVFSLAALPADVGAVYWPRGHRAAIVIDRDLTQRQRRVALAHELVHEDHGGGIDIEAMPDTMRVIAVRLERRVHDEVARKLVPPGELASLLARLEDLGPVETWEVADHFDVTEDVAQRALARLAAQEIRE